MKQLFNCSHTRLAGLVLVGALAAAGSALAFNTTKEKGTVVKLPVDETPVARTEMAHGSYAPVVKKVAPAVVKIVTTTKSADLSSPPTPGFEDPFWRRFFGDQFNRMVPHGAPGPNVQHGLGSGVIVTKDGYILTNNHVVDGAKEVKVTLQDGRDFNAAVVGRDPKSDVAVVKIDGHDLPTVTLADSDQVEIGDVVLAIGNPFGVGQTVTSGIVSAKDRGNMGIEDYEDFIQTDAAINPGNSGGALVDIDGRLIGINTAILSRSGGSQGVGFAIPANLARAVMESLIASGHVSRGYLGVMIQNINPALADEFKLKDTKGALVSDVVADGPAAKAGLKNGDVIISYNGHPVPDSHRLRLDVAATSPGSTVPIEVLRDGASVKLEVAVKQLPGTEQVAKADSANSTDTGTLNGVGVADLDGAAREQFNVPKEVKGAIVTEVAPDSAAAQAGLKSGDVIQEINRRPVASAQDAIRLTEKSDTKRTLVRVWGNGGSHYVVVDESKNAG